MKAKKLFHLKVFDRKPSGWAVFVCLCSQLFLFLNIVSVSAQTDAGVSIQNIIDNSGVGEAFWAINVLDKEGAELENYNAGKMIMPASNQKLFTLAAALEYFGPEFRFNNQILGLGTLSDSVWIGDIVIVGSGDPTISGTLYDGDRYKVFKEWSNQLKEKGISRIEGDIIGDVSLFDDQRYPKGWDWYDMSFYYGVQISPLSFNNNAIDLTVAADGPIGTTPEINWFPDSTHYVELINRQVIAHPATEYDEFYRRELGTNKILLGSSLPQGYEEEESLSVNNPEEFFLHSFKAFLENQNFEVSGQYKISEQDGQNRDLILLAESHSVEMREIVAWANKESDNFYVEMLTKGLSAYITNEPGSFENGILQIRSYLSETGIDTSYVMMNDGSGMAAGNFSRVSDIANFLRVIQEESYFDDFYQSLAITGIDGTLAHRMKDNPMYNNFRGKTGFVTGVRTLSGYMTSKTGRQLIISIATNHFTGRVSPVDRIHESILNYLYHKY